MMKDNHILPFLWMRGEDETVIRTEVEKIYQSGIRAVCLEARPHPDYAGEGWWHDVDIVIDEAKKRKMQIWILDDAHFPTGMANGGVERKPEKARRFLFTQFVDVTGPMPAVQVDTELLMTRQFTWMDIGKPENKPLYDETSLLSVVAVQVYDGDILCGEPMDLTEKVSDGYVTADIPEGTWRIFVNFSTTAFNPKPEYINYIEEDSVRVLIDEVYERHYEKYGDLFGNVIAGFFSDEPGFYNKETYDEESYVGCRMPLPWGREMDERMKSEYGASLYREIPYLFAEAKDGEHRLLRTAYMDSASALYEKNFSRQLGNWCQEHGVEYIGHIVEDNYGHMRLGAGCGHYFRAMAGQHMAGIDNIGYQIMPCNDVASRHTGFQDLNPEFYHYQLGKLGSSAAAIDPKKKGRLMCENFGAYGWRLGVRDMKWLVDYLVCQGVNYFVPHAFSMAEYPDSDCPPHFYAGGNNPQFPYFCDLMKYTERLCTLFSDGQNVPQAAVLYEAEADWAGETMKGSRVAKELITHQVDFEFIPVDVFAQQDYYGCKVEGGELAVNGRSMKVLLVPECEFLPSKAAHFISSHPELKVYYLNHYPKGIADEADEDGTLLGAAKKGRDCVPMEGLAELLRKEGVKDELYSEKTDYDLRQYHYRKDGKDLWFFMNASSYRELKVRLHVPASVPYGCYDAFMDETAQLQQEQGEIEIVLKPYQSTVLCTEPENAKHKKVIGNQAGSIVLKQFELELHEIGKLDAEKIPEFSLQPISNIRRDFAGTMSYTADFEMAQLPKTALLSAQYVFECMTVTVNGRELPSVIAPPYELDITSGLKEGKNTVTICVASTPLRNANTKPGLFGKERTVLEPTGMFGNVEIKLFD